MSRHQEVEVTIKSACDLKNINWKHGKLLPYAVVWVDQSKKYTTKADSKRGENPKWNDQKLKIQIPGHNPVKDRYLFIDIFHDDTQNALPKKIVGSASLTLPNAGKVTQTVTLRRPSGRPHGKVEVKVSIKKICRHDRYCPKYQIPAPAPAYRTSENGYSQPVYGYPCSTPFSAYGSTSAPPPPPTPPYGFSNSQGGYASIGKPVKKSNIGSGKELTGLGAVAAVLGWLAAAYFVFSGDSSSESESFYYESESSSDESECSRCQCDDSNCEPEVSSYPPDDDWSF